MKQSTQRWLLSAALALLVACSDDPDPDPTPDGGPQPGFTVQISDDRVPILQGTSKTVTATVARVNGFTGAVDIALSGLPAGVNASPATIASDATTAEIRIEAPASAAHSLPTTVTAAGTSGDKSASDTFTVTVYGPPGSLDTSFAGGKVLTPVGLGEDYAEAMAVQADGKIVVVGRATVSGSADIAVVRYNRDGTLDTSFDTDGKVTTAVGAESDEAYAVAIQPDGKIVVAGSSESDTSNLDFVLVRYNPDGSLDNSFDGDGKVVTVFGNAPDRVYALAIQSDGKIVAGGESNRGATAQDFALARYNPDGSLDTTFDGDGQVVTLLKAGAARDTIYALTLQTIGTEQRILAAGGEGDFLLARYTSTGALDTTFDTDGKIVGLFSSVVGAARGVAITTDGKIVAAGQITNDLTLVRLNANGSLDTSFDGDGKVVTALNPSNNDEATALALQEDGKIVVGGWVYPVPGSSGDFAVVRYEANGALDTTFGTGGKVVTPVAAGTRNDQARAMVLQRDERVPTVRILLSGLVSDANNDFAVSRYWP